MKSYIGSPNTYLKNKGEKKIAYITSASTTQYLLANQFIYLFIFFCENLLANQVRWTFRCLSPNYSINHKDWFGLTQIIQEDLNIYTIVII